MAATRNMTDIVWQALREPRGTITVGGTGTISEVYTLDSDGLELAFKYFTCSMLTLRLAGIAQINVDIHLFSHSYSYLFPVFIITAVGGLR